MGVPPLLIGRGNPLAEQMPRRNCAIRLNEYRAVLSAFVRYYVASRGIFERLLCLCEFSGWITIDRSINFRGSGSPLIAQRVRLSRVRHARARRQCKSNDLQLQTFMNLRAKVREKYSALPIAAPSAIIPLQLVQPGGKLYSP